MISAVKARAGGMDTRAAVGCCAPKPKSPPLMNPPVPRLFSFPFHPHVPALLLHLFYSCEAAGERWRRSCRLRLPSNITECAHSTHTADHHSHAVFSRVRAIISVRHRLLSPRGGNGSKSSSIRTSECPVNPSRLTSFPSCSAASRLFRR